MTKYTIMLFASWSYAASVLSERMACRPMKSVTSSPISSLFGSPVKGAGLAGYERGMLSSACLLRPKVALAFSFRGKICIEIVLALLVRVISNSLSSTDFILIVSFGVSEWIFRSFRGSFIDGGVVLGWDV